MPYIFRLKVTDNVFSLQKINEILLCKVVYIDHKRNNSADSFMSLDSSESQCDDGYRTSSSSSESSFSLHNIDVSSLLSCKSKDDAIVAMVTGGHYATSRLQVLFKKAVKILSLLYHANVGRRCFTISTTFF